jgi:hypothetical protein
MSAGVKVTTEKYEIWPGSFRISNGSVDLVVVPKVGRIMRFGEVGHPNLLWEGERVNDLAPAVGAWINWGGDKVWPAPQDTWGWPPEQEYDGAAWDVQAIPNGVHMASKARSAKLGLRFERTILLKPGANSAEIRNTLINNSGKTVRLAVWEVCQVNDPEECILPIWKSKSHPNGWKVYGDDKVDAFVRERGGELHVTRDPLRGLKYGSGSPQGSITAVVGGYTISVKSVFDESAEYPDGGNAQQLYTSPDPTKYAELELSGPLTSLAPGQSASITVTMSLRRK